MSVCGKELFDNNIINNIYIENIEVSVIKKEWLVIWNIRDKTEHIGLYHDFHKYKEYIQDQVKNKITDLKINFYFKFMFQQIHECELRFMLLLFSEAIKNKDKEIQQNLQNILIDRENIDFDGQNYEIIVEDNKDLKQKVDLETLRKEINSFLKIRCNLKPIQLIKVSSQKKSIIVPDLAILTDLHQFPLNKKDYEIFRKNFSYIQGYVLFPTVRLCRNGYYQFTFFLSQEDYSIKIVFYVFSADSYIKEQNLKKLQTELKSDTEIRINLFNARIEQFNEQISSLIYDLKEDISKASTIYEILSILPSHLSRKDDFLGKKRIEFHVHTKMSNLDAITSAQDYLQIAENWGHEAIAFTDHHGIYAYPEIYECTKNKKIKPIYGVELDFIEEKPIYITNQHQDPCLKDFILKAGEYVVFDLETTGFSPHRNRIIEIAGFKIKDCQIVDQFHALVNPEELLSQKISSLSNITDEQLQKAETISQVLPKFLKFVENHCLIAHNTNFDINFLKVNLSRLNISFPQCAIIDTLTLAQEYFGDIVKFFSLKRLAAKFKVKLEQHHQAINDAKATAEIFLQMLKFLEEQHNVFSFFDLKKPINHKYEKSYHINVLAKNQKGYRDLCQILSNSLTENFYKIPLTSKSILAANRQDLLIGSGCYNSNIFKIALDGDIADLCQAILFYDYIEIQPPNAYNHIISSLEINGHHIIEDTLLKIIKESKRQNKIIIATGDVHYLYQHEKLYREIYINAKLIGGGLHPLAKFDYSDLPDNYLLTTQEMLTAFNFLDPELAEEIVITNTHKLNQQIENIQIFPNKLFVLSDNAFENSQLKIKSIKQEIKNLVNKKKTLLYGEQPHPIIHDRIKQELKSILGNAEIFSDNINFTAPIYYLSYLLVQKSLADGYLVGSRGSVGSSLVAYILEITEVNPLPPHYICSNCHYTIMKTNTAKIRTDSDEKFYSNLSKVYSGYDLPDDKCPKCSNLFRKDGHDIPFETFLGFHGNKIPDIDLNFAGNYQLTAHDYMKELLGPNNVFKAGTIQTVAERNAYGYVKSFLEDKKQFLTDSEISRRAKKIEGVKRSTGQHPGGIIVVPSECSIFDVTPVQFPANDTTSAWKTTHFDYHSFENNLLKLDLLGHDDPIMIKFLMDYVRQHPQEFAFQKSQDIPLDDLKVYEEIFFNKNKKYSTLGIPEFGTPFVKKMLEDISYKKDKLTFADLVKISGLSHGTNVWRQNTDDLIIEKNLNFSAIIGCRDDIMLQLIDKNIKPLMAFEIMEFIRKGGPSVNDALWQKYKKIMKKHNVEEWYITSASKIKYLFPKAHAVAYVIMAMRIAWFKVYHPLLFYSGFFSKRVDHFDYDAMIGGSDSINQKIKFLRNKKKKTAKEENLINILHVALEFTQHKEGFTFDSIDINQSDRTNFLIKNNKTLLMPLVSLEGLGPVVASRIISERNIKLFSKQDFLKRSKVNKTIFAKMKNMGLLDALLEE